MAVDNNDDIILSGATSTCPQWTTTEIANISDWSYIPALSQIPEYAVNIDGNMTISGTIDSKEINKLKEEVKKIKEANKMAQMGLYEIYVVNKKENLHAKNTVIAKDDRIAERKVGFPEVWDLDNLVFFTRCIGQWKSEKPQKVKIVKE